MKVDGTNKTSGTKGTGKTGAKKSTGDTSFSGLVDETEEAQAPKPISSVMSIGQLDALLSLQEAPDGTSEEAARKGKKRAALLLDQLDKVKIGLLSGGIEVTTLQHLQNTISSHRQQVSDPGLGEVLDEIELRVQVELAKLGRL